jgi:2-methylisocitrate lyase-like PEP mutase family enzyme
MKTNARVLRDMLERKEMIVAPGAYDALTAMLVERMGFAAVYMTGAGVSASWGLPDYGLLSMTEITTTLERMTSTVDVPVIADADTGYGNELNVVRTVREFESRGVAALHIEDQAFPKKCGHLEQKQVIPLEEYTRKIAAAAYARKNPDLVLIARSDARAPLGFEEAVRRVNAALEAGADIGFVEAPESMEEIEAIPKLVKGPCMINLVRGGKTPVVSLDLIRDLGYAIAICPGMALMTIINAYEDALKHLMDDRIIPQPMVDISIPQVLERVKSLAWDKDRATVAG